MCVVGGGEVIRFQEKQICPALSFLPPFSIGSNSKNKKNLPQRSDK